MLQEKVFAKVCKLYFAHFCEGIVWKLTDFYYLCPIIINYYP